MTKTNKRVTMQAKYYSTNLYHNASFLIDPGATCLLQQHLDFMSLSLSHTHQSDLGILNHGETTLRFQISGGVGMRAGLFSHREDSILESGISPTLHHSSPNCCFPRSKPSFLMARRKNTRKTPLPFDLKHLSAQANE